MVTDTRREVLQQALEFAEFVWRECSINDFAEEKRYVLENALRAELANPAPFVATPAQVNAALKAGAYSRTKLDRGFMKLAIEAAVNLKKCKGGEAMSLFLHPQKC